MKLWPLIVLPKIHKKFFTKKMLTTFFKLKTDCPLPPHLWGTKGQQQKLCILHHILVFKSIENEINYSV